MKSILNEIQALSAGVKINAALEKIPDAEKKLDELVKRLEEESVLHLTYKEELDAFKADMGEEHYQALCNNPAFKELLDEWRKQKVNQTIQNMKDSVLELLKESSDPKAAEITGEDVMSFLRGVIRRL